MSGVPKRNRPDTYRSDASGQDRGLHRHVEAGEDAEVSEDGEKR